MFLCSHPMQNDQFCGILLFGIVLCFTCLTDKEGLAKTHNRKGKIVLNLGWVEKLDGTCAIEAILHSNGLTRGWGVDYIPVFCQ